MSVMEWGDIFFNTNAVLDPAWSTAIGSLAAAISMAIITIVSYYFPKDHTKFDEYEIGEKKRKRKKKQLEEVDEENGG